MPWKFLKAHVADLKTMTCNVMSDKNIEKSEKSINFSFHFQNFNFVYKAYM